MAPSRSVRSGYGTINASSYSRMAPKPLQRGQAPLGELNENNCGVVSIAKRGSHGIRDAPTCVLGHDEPVDDDQQLRRERDVQIPGLELIEVHDHAVDAQAHESLLAEILDDDLVRDFVRQYQRCRD